MTLYRTHLETKASSVAREPYYIHTANGREAVNASRAKSSTSSSPTNPSTKTDTTAPSIATTDSTVTLINPIHPPEICPPSTSRWQRLKDENEERKSRERVRLGSEEVERISGRDSRGFKRGEEDGWTERQKDVEAKRVWDCMVM